MRDNPIIYLSFGVGRAVVVLAIRERLAPIFESYGHESQLLGVDCGSMIKAYEAMSRIEDMEKFLILSLDVPMFPPYVKAVASASLGRMCASRSTEIAQGDR